MAQAQKVSRSRRFFGWFGRHKVLAVFAVLFVGLGLYLVGSWGVLQVQIHFERKEFMSVEADVTQIGKDLGGATAPQAEHYCYYESSPAEFTKGKRLCVVRLTIANTAVEKSVAIIDSTRFQKVVTNALGQDKGYKGDKYSLASSRHGDNNIDCFLRSEYYDSGVSAGVRASRATKNGAILYSELTCSSVAKAEYFPVKD